MVSVVLEMVHFPLMSVTGVNSPRKFKKSSPQLVYIKPRYGFPAVIEFFLGSL